MPVDVNLIERTGSKTTEEGYPDYSGFYDIDLLSKVMNEHFDAKARFMTKDAHFETFLEGFAKDIGWDADALKEVSHGFVVSQFDYRPGLIMILVALIILLIAACAVYMIANLIYIWKPHLHPACRRRKIC